MTLQELSEMCFSCPDSSMPATVYVFDDEEETHSVEVKKCYGKNNEFAYVLNTIKEKKLNLL